jgi:hypothetical protein
MFNESLDLISGSFRILFFDSSSLGWSPFGHGSTVTRSKRRFHAKTKPNNILALTAPTPAPCHPFAPLRFAPCPPVSVFVSLPLK